MRGEIVRLVESRDIHLVPNALELRRFDGNCH